MSGTVSIRLYSSRIEFPGSNVAIEYEVVDGDNGQSSSEGIDIWSSDTSFNSGVYISTLEVASGGGKSTLAQALYSYLRNQTKDQLSFAIVPPGGLKKSKVGMIPQRAATILHWMPKNLLPRKSIFLECLFEGQNLESRIFNEHLSRFSGGQAARILVASALERLFHAGQRSNFLILDEAFEGIGAIQANKILKLIKMRWLEFAPNRALSLLIVSHLNANDLILELDVNRIALSPKAPVEMRHDGRSLTLTQVKVQRYE